MLPAVDSGLLYGTEVWEDALNKKIYQNRLGRGAKKESVSEIAGVIPTFLPKSSELCTLGILRLVRRWQNTKIGSACLRGGKEPGTKGLEDAGLWC